MAQILRSGLSWLIICRVVSYAQERDCERSWTEVGSYARMKVFSFYFERFMMSRPLSWAFLPSRGCVPMPEGKTRRAVCSSICDGWELQASIEGYCLLASTWLPICCSLRPQIAHYVIKGGATPLSIDWLESPLGMILTEKGSMLLKDLMPSIISCACWALWLLVVNWWSLNCTVIFFYSQCVFCQKKTRIRFSFSYSLRQSVSSSSNSGMSKTEVILPEFIGIIPIFYTNQTSVTLDARLLVPFRPLLLITPRRVRRGRLYLNGL